MQKIIIRLLSALSKEIKIGLIGVLAVGASLSCHSLKPSAQAAEDQPAESVSQRGLASGGMSKEMNTIIRKANSGDAKSQYQLGLFYREKKQYSRSYIWFDLAARKGHTEAQYYAGFYRLDLDLDAVFDVREAVKWLKPAAEKGHTEAQYYMGYIYRAGLLDFHNNYKAAKWWRLAADQGHAGAQYGLGALAEWSRGGLKEHEAFKWFKLAADQGYKAAQYELGRLYYKGDLGVRKNRREAFKWFKLAADQGYKAAQKDALDRNGFK